MTEQGDRFALTTGPDGRVLLTLALRRRPRASADGFARAQRYWACAPGGGQPRWLALAGAPADLLRYGEHPEDAREVEDAHAAAAAYLPGVSCSWCGERQWKPVNRAAVTRYVRTGATGTCLTCRVPSVEGPVAAPVTPAPVPAAGDLRAAQLVAARELPAVTVRVGGAAAALLWTATGGDAQRMSSLVTELVSSNFGILRAG